MNCNDQIKVIDVGMDVTVRSSLCYTTRDGQLGYYFEQDIGLKDSNGNLLSGNENFVKGEYDQAVIEYSEYHHIVSTIGANFYEPPYSTNPDRGVHLQRIERGSDGTFKVLWNKALLVGMDITDLTFSRIDTNKTLLVFMSNKSLYTGLLVDESFRMLDSIAIYEHPAFSTKYDAIPNVYTEINRQIVKPAHVQNYITFLSNIKYYLKNDKGLDLLLASQNVLFRLDIDSGTLHFKKSENAHVLFNKIDEVGAENQIYEELDFNKWGNRIEISPNDSFCYFLTYEIYKIEGSVFYYRGILRTVNCYSDLQEKLYLAHTYESLKLGISGSLFLLDSEHPSRQSGGTDRSENKIWYSIFLNSNNGSLLREDLFWKNDSLLFKPRYYKYPGNIGENISFDFYDYLRFKPEIEYSCTANVKFNNISDFNSDLDSFIWYFVLDNDEIDTLIDFEPRLEYSKNGDYPFKCYGSSSKGRGYGEWYFDTLHIRIPQKPVANFLATDRVFCSYNPVTLTFKNLSTADTIHPTNGQKWVWTFGDGQTQTSLSSQNLVSHTYKTPGFYTVSLFYSNGFCDSTLVKNQYIEVVDAPNPGFTVDNSRGCTPFTVHFTDTVTRNVTKKEYYFSDIDQWQEIATQQFSHTIATAGTHYAVQRLYGFTGCVTQLDTAYFYVTKGLTNADSSHILTATYVHDFADPKKQPITIQLAWNQLDATTEYQITRNGRSITNQPINKLTNQLTDTIPTPEAYTYQVIATDSCGTKASVGRIGQLMLLKGEVIGNNEYAVIEFTPYSQWTEPITYQLYEVTIGATVPITTQTPTQTYRDDNLLRDKEIEKCYVVEAFTQSGNRSWSNILCLPYKPLVFIPNAISPNNDNLNETFAPQTYGIEQYEMQIYNRWGEKVYSGTNGSWQPNPNDRGVFIYHLNLKTAQGNWQRYNGTVTIVKLTGKRFQ
ncbi:MAG: gliding motility-associated C-terminal domain-containing protein [Flavobacteriales bacterium]|nr:gliding motility-associated C-terminal domain-containing protein [Flavobacteriales bacterium]